MHNSAHFCCFCKRCFYWTMTSSSRVRPDIQTCSHISPSGQISGWLFCWWVFRFLIQANPLPHIPQLYGFSPVWTLWCFRRFPASENIFPHVEQLKGFSPVWTRWWISTFFGRLKALPQKLHTNSLSLVAGRRSTLLSSLKDWDKGGKLDPQRVQPLTLEEVDGKSAAAIKYEQEGILPSAWTREGLSKNSSTNKLVLLLLSHNIPKCESLLPSSTYWGEFFVSFSESLPSTEASSSHLRRGEESLTSTPLLLLLLLLGCCVLLTWFWFWAWVSCWSRPGFCPAAPRGTHSRTPTDKWNEEKNRRRKKKGKPLWKNTIH